MERVISGTSSHSTAPALAARTLYITYCRHKGAQLINDDVALCSQSEVAMYEVVITLKHWGSKTTALKAWPCFLRSSCSVACQVWNGVYTNRMDCRNTSQSTACHRYSRGSLPKCNGKFRSYHLLTVNSEPVNSEIREQLQVHTSWWRSGGVFFKTWDQATVYQENCLNCVVYCVEVFSLTQLFFFHFHMLT